MINSTLFIGLGTTGLEILKLVQEMIWEHYGEASLPIFRFVAFETDERKKIELPSWGSHRIDLFYPTIANVPTIETDIESGKKKYLENWLNRKLLEIPDLKEGASHIRMAGKLCLWENWIKGCRVKKVLNDAKKDIQGEDNITETRKFLKDFYLKKWGKKENDLTQTDRKRFDDKIRIGTFPNVYIVGTLCGGTCGGMFIDIGYYTKWLFNLWSDRLPDGIAANVTGVFTIYDAQTLTGTLDEMGLKRAANCWTALTEYDYWCHPNSTFDIEFPGMDNVKKTNEPPLDYIYLQSCSGNEINLYKGGEPDTDTINHMAAMVLFSGTVGDLLEKRGSIITNYRGIPRSSNPDAGEHMPCFASCGMSAVWYPKYRISEAVACKYGAEIIEDWKGGLDSNGELEIKKEKKDVWRKILDDARPKLTRGPDGDLGQEIVNSLDGNLPDKGMRELLKNEFKKLTQKGKFDSFISDQGRQQRFQKSIENAIELELTKMVNEKKSIAYAKYFLIYLDEQLSKSIKACPNKYPSTDSGKYMNALEADEWSKLVIKSKEVLEQKKIEVLDDCRNFIISQIDKIADFEMKTTLKKVKNFLGIDEQPFSDEIEIVEKSLKQKLDEIEGRLDNCITNLENRAKELSKAVRETQDLKIIFKRSLKEDIEFLVEKLKNLNKTKKDKIIQSFIPEGNLFHHYLGYGSISVSEEKISKAIQKSLFSECFDQIEGFNIAEEFMHKYPSPSERRRFAKVAIPRVELNDENLASEIVGDPPEFIIGKDDDNLTNIGALAESLNEEGEPDKIEFRQLIHSDELDHLLCFYKEEGLIYMDENVATAGLFENHVKDAEKKSQYGLYTHQEGREFFDIWMIKQREEAKEKLVPIARKILSVKDKDGVWQNSEIYGVEKGNLILRFKDKSGSKVTLHGTEEKNIDSLEKNKEAFEYFKDRVFSKLQAVGEDGYIARLNDYLDWVEEDGINQGDSPSDALEKERK